VLQIDASSAVLICFK
ncbi:hypothetical protein AYX14_05691, partial [Cryptococcus neoformans]